jgi:Tol biopolymer transport system component
LNIWLVEPARETFTRLTFETGADAYPVWTPDGKRIIFSFNRTGVYNLYWKSADGGGSEERLTESVNSQQGSFSSKPSESPSATRHLIKHRKLYTRLSSVVKRGWLIQVILPYLERQIASAEKKSG